MSVNSFIPEKWNDAILWNFREAAVAAAIVNREYEGDAVTGNKVKVNTGVHVEIKDYKDGSGNRSTSPDAIVSAAQDLLIDQEDVFDFIVDDIDAAQAAGPLTSPYTSSAAEGLAQKADKFIMSTAVENAGNIVYSTGGAFTSKKAFDTVRALRKALNKRSTPGAQRYLVCNAEFEAELLAEESKLTSVDASGSPAGLRSGIVGSLLGFTVVTSENLPEVDEPQAVAFYGPAIAFVNQLNETEAMRAENQFADRIRGLNVYGARVIRPSNVAVYTKGVTEPSS